DCGALCISAPADVFGLTFDGPSTGATNQYLPLEQMSDVFSKVTRLTGYLDASYELTDNVEIYTELLFNNRKSYNNSFQQVSVFQFTGDSTRTGALPVPITLLFCDPSVTTCTPGDVGDP